MSRCTGHCCRDFSLSWDTIDCLTSPPDVRRAEDGDYIRDMLVWKRWDEKGRGWFTCRHFDGRDCTAYDQRPRMCRTFPDGRECRYVGCTLRSA